MCTGFELESLSDGHCANIIFKLLNQSSSTTMHILAMECLVYTKSFRICKKNPSMLTLTWVMPNLVNSEKSSEILPLCQAKSQFLIFSCLSIFFWPRGISGYPKHGPQSTCWITRSVFPTAVPFRRNLRCVKKGSVLANYV